ncbi:hypothetical protein [Albibacillus kandeliae]|uniref:hypothetical protein n=1 Tax=Albibacillus kandeliae TaxID=2174228 RepID=UPI000D687398|nr:hypothetical protein [Albibacillus kandeliae]
MQKLTFIAETDTQGRVAWVWAKRPAWKAARPADARSISASDLARAQFHGAAEDDIRAWVSAQARGGRAQN